MLNNIAQNELNYKLRAFEGPLDLLLFLIKKNEVDIYDIPIAEITEQYLLCLNYATKMDLENMTEFYVLAATLLYIKSCLLIPVDIDLDDQFEDPRKELVDQLIDYQKYKKLGHLMENDQPEAEWILNREKNQIILPFKDEDIWEEVAVWDLLKVFSGLVSSVSMERVIDLYEEVTVNEKTTLIYEYLESKSEFAFTDIIKNRNSIYDVVCTFLAVLEMVKQNIISVHQNKLFGDIKISNSKYEP